MAREKTVKIPAGVEVSLNGKVVTVKGPKGSVKTELPPVNATVDKGEFSAVSDDKAARNTALALVRSAVKGVTEGYQCRMQMVYAHFPMTIETKGKEIVIKNFLGEKIPRVANLVGDTTIKVEKDILVVNGPNAHAVGQTVANIRTATKIKNKDSRVFQDGVYPLR